MDSILALLEQLDLQVHLLAHPMAHIERDAEGDFWTVEKPVRPDLKLVDQHFQDDTIVKFNSNGDILFERSLGKLLIANGMQHILYGQGVYQKDPFHLNDIQPALTDGRYWKKAMRCCVHLRAI